LVDSAKAEIRPKGTPFPPFFFCALCDRPPAQPPLKILAFFFLLFPPFFFFLLLSHHLAESDVSRNLWDGNVDKQAFWGSTVFFFSTSPIYVAIWFVPDFLGVSLLQDRSGSCRRPDRNSFFPMISPLERFFLRFGSSVPFSQPQPEPLFFPFFLFFFSPPPPYSRGHKGAVQPFSPFMPTDHDLKSISLPETSNGLTHRLLPSPNEVFFLPSSPPEPGRFFSDIVSVTSLFPR